MLSAKEFCAVYIKDRKISLRFLDEADRFGQASSAFGRDFLFFITACYAGMLLASS
ncbi:hypothetical protein BAXH7_03916 [Bacillus amyloliquefaciens XH7]|uniref:Uncharacterized protein n=1 Tax=Bacillus amyloliquefaciens (strain ATCC 23350 / DSM 7 / BCRC 11601 / CCUG 28519 / NBRC 15535 / NRRL B-14393 / F) TaxID=692420 RepID=A0A9P1NJJ2_BACAS|nr:hypothetical protein BAMTA208_19130 [Bacillus amyloliquefaciens TA208]AEB65449.1 hypothetical protein LL3_03924 [Bacillus amyloliquefaciens LL3]AEK91024.1 hypothetical protein BAXH7_03916 [Bacillus amyloliquefaciens XH7]KYC98821.1 hypothetical protein B425_3287 [Bacillus amyloliquefaciens]CBI44739.1 hypothetical protein predicted by Glimmer/Critica [Bacillus amyloliquefaciens DSM 7] [Bacillus amyloliquefaciens DSM 7 = ATCC 23350]